MGWAPARLPDVALITMGQSPPGTTYNKIGHGLPFFQGKADFGSRHPSVRVYCSAPNKLAAAGDVLISVRAPVGPTNLADADCAIGRGLAAVRPSPGIPSEFLLFYLRTIETDLASEGTGSTFTAISRKNLDAITIPLPPLAEQRRIAERVDALLAQVDAVRARLARATTLLKRFRQSVLAAACSGRLTEDWRITGAGGHDWAATTLSAESTLITSGSRGWARYYSDSGARFIRSEDINSDRLTPVPTAFVQLPTGSTEGMRTRVRRYDVLVTITGANVTKCAFVLGEPGEAYVSQHVALVRPRCQAMAPYLWLVLVSPTDGRAQLVEAAYGAGKPGLNLTNVGNVRISLPPLAEQHEIVRRVEALFALAESIEARVTTASASAEKLTQAILARAFRGELVPTEAELARREGRDYETGAQLLEWIKVERAASGGTPKARGRRGKAAPGMRFEVVDAAEAPTDGANGS
ncbi:MAG: restriction endonuclease subunit S [Dehalococcoidia bacterium]